MLINAFSVFNYKSYRATAEIELSPGFNVFIGKNNSGKTALLEALSLSTLVNKPHRHSGIPRGQPLHQHARVDLTGAFVAESIYSFRAERLSVSAYPYGDSAILEPNAQNLPVVLNVLQGHHVQFERFNSLVNQVFPSIRRVSIIPRGRNSQIFIWNVDAPADRVDLANELAESGTGVGQVLAMLYIIVTSESPRTSIIDEPTPFFIPVPHDSLSR
jgi:predicted ATPase